MVGFNVVVAILATCMSVAAADIWFGGYQPLDQSQNSEINVEVNRILESLGYPPASIAVLAAWSNVDVGTMFAIFLKGHNLTPCRIRWGTISWKENPESIFGPSCNFDVGKTEFGHMGKKASAGRKIRGNRG